jgi:sec-independent protein translocase protein TatC
MTATASPRDDSPTGPARAPGEGSENGPGRVDAHTYVGEEMTLVEHLRELRQRLFKSAVAVVIGFLVGFVFRHQVFDILIQPYCRLPSQLRAGSEALNLDGCNLVILDVLGFFFISLKAAAVVAVVVAGPVVFYQLWRFVTPGLRPIERRYALPFVIVSQLLFAGGAVFAYVVIPRGLEFLLGFAGPQVVSLMDASRYLSFMLHTMIGFGVAFELPLILIMLSLMGVVQSSSLRRYRRQSVFGIFVAAAIITPTQDPLTLTVMALPLWLFFEISVLVARLVERRRARAEAAAAGS